MKKGVMRRSVAGEITGLLTRRGRPACRCGVRWSIVPNPVVFREAGDQGPIQPDEFYNVRNCRFLNR
jgi:hypothetical protein